MGLLLRLLLAVVLLQLPARAADQASGARPSVIFLLVDTLRADYLGCYGFQGEISPNIDRLCGESVVFDQCFSQAPWTKPAIATLFTSLDPVAHQVNTHRGQYAQPEVGEKTQTKPKTDVLPGSVVTIAEALHQSGYATAAFVANPWIRKDVGFGQGFEVYEDNFAANGTDADVLIDAARAWLDQRPKDRRFFLYLHFMDVHDPYDAPQADFDVIKESPSLGPERQLAEDELSKGLLRALRPVGAHWADKDQPDRLKLRTWRGRYGAGVRAFDRRVQPLLDYLRASGLDRETMLVLTSDHGEELFEHGGWAHGLKLFDHQLHVPLIVRPAGGLKGGKRIGGLIGLIDIAPTLVASLKLTPPRGWRGKSFDSVLAGKGGKKIDQAALFATSVKWQPSLFAVRTREFKLLRDRSSAKEQLFHLSKDPAELRDVRPKNAAVAKMLRALLDQHLRKSKAGAADRPAEVEIDKATSERLRALGY